MLDFQLTQNIIVFAMAGTIEAPRNIDYTRATVMDRAQSFPQIFLKDGLRVTDQRTITLVDDLQSGRFWGVLSALDGSTNPSQPDTLEAREEKRTWAKSVFTMDEIDILSTISIDNALSSPQKTSWPGTNRAHAILYHALVKDNPGSLFEGRVSEGLRRRIINGSFWESIPEISFQINGGTGIGNMEGIITEHFEELDVQFAKEGYALFQNNSGEEVEPDLIHLSEKTFLGYIKFIREVEKEHEDLGLNQEQMGYLIDPINKVGSRKKRRVEREMMREIGLL